jgi:cytochrome d ubiquinol oxidase subunit II
LEALWTTENLAFVQNISLGLAVFFLARVLANLYFQNNIKDENIYKKSQKSLIYNSVLFLIFFLFWLIRLLFLDGFAVNPSNGEVFMEPNKYFHNFLEMPLVLAVFLIGVVMVLAGIAGNMFFKSKKGFGFPAWEQFLPFGCFSDCRFQQHSVLSVYSRFAEFTHDL